MKKQLAVIALVILAIITGIIGFFWFQDRDQAEQVVVANDYTDITDKAVKNETADAEITSSEETIEYTNATYSFQLELPTSWKGYSVTELTGNDPGNVPDKVLVFNTPNFEELFSIDVWFKQENEDVPQAVLESEKQLLGENKNYYFEYEGIALTVLEDSGLSTEEIANIQLEIKNTADSFNLTDF